MKTSSGRRGANRTVMPTWYRAPSAPAANRPAHGTPQQAPGVRYTAAKRPRTHPAGIRPAPAACEPRTASTPALARASSKRRHTNAHPARRRTGRQGFRFREKWEQSANNPLPTSPENSTGLSANPTELQIFFPVLANLELHDTCPPTNSLRQFPHRSKTAFLASASFPVRNISTPSVPQTPPQPTARRSAHGRIQPTTRTRRAPAGARESARYARAPSPARYALSSTSRAPRASSS